LTTQDRQLLVGKLKDLPELATESARRSMLNLAGLEKLVPNMDISPPTITAVIQIVTYLETYGRLSYEHESLGVFLNTIKEQFAGLELQPILDELLLKYQMMTPVAPNQPLINWRGQDTTDSVQEKIFGENTLRPIAFLAQGLKVARTVARIETPDALGTGFLIAPDLLLTNHHVLNDLSALTNAIFSFNYETDFAGKPLTLTNYPAKSGGTFHANEKLDYAVVQLDGEPGKAIINGATQEQRGWIALKQGEVRPDGRVNIIQHPGGRAKEIAMQNNFVAFVGGGVVQYVTATQPGSSGSPVFNNEWEIVGLHHAGGNIREPGSDRRYFRNEGILISAILNDLPGQIKALLVAAI
jgi:V8-like Glu-specific endopeptidase